MKFSTLAIAILGSFLLDATMADKSFVDGKAPRNLKSSKSSKSTKSPSTPSSSSKEEPACDCSETDPKSQFVQCANEPCATECTYCINPPCRRCRHLEFVDHPVQGHIDEMVTELDGDTSASFVRATNVLPSRSLEALRSFIETAYQAEGYTEQKLKNAVGRFVLNVKGAELAKIIGEEDTKVLLDLFQGQFGDEQPVNEMFFLRIDDRFNREVAFHHDLSANVMTLLINDDFVGGKMVYLTDNGAVKVDNEAGMVLLHSPMNIHGAEQVEEGPKYVLFLVSHPEGSVEATSVKDVFGDFASSIN